MNYFIALDVVQGGDGVPVALVFIAAFVGMILLEGGILTLFGMRPVDKAFVNSFLVNMAACAVGFVMVVVATSIDMQGVGAMVVIGLSIVLVQGLVLGKNPVNLSLSRAWLAAIVMKVSSFGLIGLLIYLVRS